MISLFIRYFFIILCSAWSYLKILNLRKTSIFDSLICCMVSLGISLLIFPLNGFDSFIRLTFSILLFFPFINLFFRIKFDLSLLITFLSFAFSLLSLAISTFIVSFYITISGELISLFSTWAMLITGILQTIFIYLIFKIKRLQNGMPFIYNTSFINGGLIFSLIIICIFFIIQFSLPSSRSTRHLLLILVIFIVITFLIWWRRKLTKSYVDKLRVDEIEELYLKVSDRDLEIDKLKAEVDHLSAIIHKDNKVIPAMDMAVRNYLQNAASMKPEDAKQYGNELLIQLEKMTEDRKGILRDYHDAVLYRPQIGLCSVDAIILYMENRALERGIDYSYRFDKGLKDTMLRYISEEDANHFLADVIENAIIATTNASTKKIKIHIGFIQDNLFMDISDSGIPFEPETYQDFGTTQHTTHKDNGGSGIGLMDIWKLKKKYKISLQIYEYPPKENGFTKKIRFFFDRKDHFLIQSYRAREVRSAVIRNDLYVFQYVNEENEVAMLNIDN